MMIFGLKIAALLGFAILLVIAILLVVVAVHLLQQRRANRFTVGLIERGAMQTHPPARLPVPETDAERALREAYEGKRPVRKVKR